MASLVPVADLAREIGPFDADETARAEGFLAEASDLAREIGKSTWTEAGGSDPAPVSVRLAVKASARRAMNEDPDGYSRESLGDWSGSKARTDTEETGIFFSDKEIAKIRHAAGKPQGVFSVRTPSPYREDFSDLVLPTDGQGIPYTTEV